MDLIFAVNSNGETPMDLALKDVNHPYPYNIDKIEDLVNANANYDTAFCAPFRESGTTEAVQWQV